MSDIATKNQSNLSVYIAQHANSLASDMMSIYWASSEGEPVPGAFIAQAEQHMKIIKHHLDMLKGYRSAVGEKR